MFLLVIVILRIWSNWGFCCFLSRALPCLAFVGDIRAFRALDPVFLVSFGIWYCIFIACRTNWSMSCLLLP